MTQQQLLLGGSRRSMGSQEDAAGGSVVSGFLHRLGWAGMLHVATHRAITHCSYWPFLKTCYASWLCARMMVLQLLTDVINVRCTRDRHRWEVPKRVLLMQGCYCGAQQLRSSSHLCLRGGCEGI